MKKLKITKKDVRSMRRLMIVMKAKLVLGVIFVK